LEEDCGGGREVNHWALVGGLWRRKRGRPLGTWRRKRGRPLGTWRRTVEEEES
jgi:hypothetical protein